MASLFTPLNIVLVQQARKIAWTDLRDIGMRICAKASHIKVHGVSPLFTAETVPDGFWTRPTMTVSFGPVGHFNPPRGPVFANRAISKLEQASRFSDADIPTPRTEAFRFGMQLDPEEWGDFVILKPAVLRLTSRSDGIYLFRTERLGHLAEVDLPPEHMARRAKMLVQQFIDTGHYPSKQRVTTLFGEPVHWAHSSNRSPRPALDSTNELLESAAVSTNAADARNWSFDAPGEDVLDLARRAGAAFANSPLLGLDILRCATNNKLYVVEINAGGNVWHYSSPTAAAERRAYPENFPPAEFKNWSFDRAADVLISKAIEAAA
jgi:hypothetical protein